MICLNQPFLRDEVFMVSKIKKEESILGLQIVLCGVLLSSDNCKTSKNYQ
jgi:hypothetical protein